MEEYITFTKHQVNKIIEHAQSSIDIVSELMDDPKVLDAHREALVNLLSYVTAINSVLIKK